MSTSEHGGVILYDPAGLGADQPMDTGLVRDVINRANHLADEAGQVVCNWVALSAAVGGSPMKLAYPDDYLNDEIVDGIAGSNTWFRFPLAPVWDAKIRTDGSGYRLRIRIAGAVDPEAGTPVPCDFAIVVGPVGLTETHLDRAADYDGDHVIRMITGVSGSTLQALSLDSGDTWIDVPSSTIEAAVHHTETLTDIGGTETTVTTARLEMMVCARGVVGGAGGITNAPVLYQLYAAEYIGR